MIIFVAHVIGLEEKHLQELEVLHLYHQKIVLNVTQKWLKDIHLDTLGNFGVVLNFRHVEVQEMHKMDMT
jgi:hypothetical protein